MQTHNPSPLGADLDRGRVLAKAVLNASVELGLSQKELGEIIGLSESMVSRRLKSGDLSLSGVSFNLAAYLVRVFRSLDAIAGGDRETMLGWMSNPNLDLGGPPRALIRTPAGLVDTMNYLDARRAPT
ncbi:MbcA/ParS/Xre antitoxin family protein [Aliiruegeria sabulilitoris]|uniref:MbcA/ParS/Xre antitoxin family protein n=1 Tax=Aliiruegeria sabulilitoris TaxID=1510458 RepID=UPI00082F5A37|nr:MbcA/ParS/Xre antitoxin family protein [Aliiruegeria sabulilitoris]NDR56316.1 DUF2384 domain-containing protein [Pseudoruegeria sp. M32A2M]